jgi:Phosphopantetheine attachment site
MGLKKLYAFMWPGLLGFSVPKDQPLMEAGLDSVSSVELRNSVASQFGMELPATVTFDHPSVQALAAFVASTIDPGNSGQVLQQTKMAEEVEQKLMEIISGTVCLQFLAAFFCAECLRLMLNQYPVLVKLLTGKLSVGPI